MNNTAGQEYEDLSRIENPLENNGLFSILTSLNQIGIEINRLRLTDEREMKDLLKLIAENAIKVVPDASSVIYEYRLNEDKFVIGSRVVAGNWITLKGKDEPRVNGIGRRSISDRKKILSYEEDGGELHPLRKEDGAKSVCCFPLIVGEDILGVLYVYLREDRKFTQLELLMLENFVNHAAMAFFQHRQFTIIKHDLNRKKEELSQLRHSGLLISSRRKLDETLKAILQMALEITGAHYGIFRITDKKGENLITQAVVGEFKSQPLIDALPLNQKSIMAWVANNKQPVRIFDLRELPWKNNYFPFDSEIEMRSEIAVPIIDASGRLIGVINLESPQVGAFTEDDDHMLQAFATQAAIALQDINLLDILQELTYRLLNESGQKLLMRLVELACDLLSAAASAIWLQEGDQVVLKACYPDLPREDNLPLIGSLTGLAIISQAEIVSNDISADPRFYCRDLARKYGWSGALIIPIQNDFHSEAIGAFSIYSRHSGSGRFVESDWDKKVLSFLAQFAALAVKNDERLNEIRIIQEQKAIAEAFAVFGDIAANLLHNVNNKLGTIPVRIQGIKNKSRAGVESDIYLSNNLDEIEHAATDAMTSVRDNLAYLRPLNSNLIDIEKCVLDAIHLSKLSPEIEFHLENLSEIPWVLANEKSLVFVFANLFENASNAMKGNGKISIYGKELEDFVEIFVEDNGPGISREIQEKIFEFDYSDFRLSNPGKLGFGLWWVKTLMNRLGGFISVEPNKENGSIFKIRLPKSKGDN